MIALAFADNPEGVTEKGIKKYSRITEREFRELIRKGYLEPVKEKKAVKKYRTTESGRTHCVENASNLSVIKYVKLIEEGRLSTERFLEILRLRYNELVKASPIAPYVKISDLRLKISEELKISGNEFDRRIMELNSNDPYTVQLHTGSGESEGGIKTTRGVYYYAIVK